VSAQNQFFGISSWQNLDISLYRYTITLVTLHRGGAEAYSFVVPTADDATTINPLRYTVCGKKTDALANNVPC
jgi:hypothetical protein